MNYNNYLVSGDRGKFYLKSTEPEKDYEEVNYGGGRKMYHKYFDCIEGVLERFSTKEIQLDSCKKLQFLELIFINGEDYNIISFPSDNNKKSTNGIKTLISKLNFSDIGENMSLKIRRVALKSNKKSEHILIYYLNKTST